MTTYSWRKTSAPMMANGGRTDDIWFFDEETGWAINSNGQVLFTNNGGKSWVEKFRASRSYLRCISFSSRQTGWVGTTTSQSRLFKTKDGGETWSDVPNLPSSPTAICGIHAVDDNVVYASGTNWPDRPSGIVKTIDGGESWSFIDMRAHASLLVDIYFRDANRGWVVGGFGGTKRSQVKPVVLYTEDGGSTWVNQLKGMDAVLPFGEWGWKIQFLDSEIGYVSLENFSDGAILKTTNGGKNWDRVQVNDPQGNANLEGVGFLNENEGWVGGWGDREFKGGFSSQTVDGGTTWTNANHVGKYINRFRVIGSPPRRVYASGDTVYKYSDSDDALDAFQLLDSRLIRNADSEVCESLLKIDIEVPAGAKSLEVFAWDRFGADLGIIHQSFSPTAGSKTIEWEIPRNSFEISRDHFIYRVSSGDLVESRVVIRSSNDKADSLVKNLGKRLAEAIDANAPVLPTVEEEKEAFFRMANIEDYPDFRPIALLLAKSYLSNTDFNAWDLYGKFEYSETSFDDRLKKIYDAAIPDMHSPHRNDREIITWTNGKKYSVGRASDAFVRDQLIQLAPFNLMDGVWLQNIHQARPSDEVQSRLFSIWSDEVGNGESSENHSNVYRDLLQSQGIYLPEVTSRKFLDVDFAPGVWRTPCFQMAIGMFPQEFFPELLGMTLFLEWEATPTLQPKVEMLRGRGMNPLFYSLHVAIDNISQGHGALAKEAVKLFLEEKKEEGGTLAVEAIWQRIWNGYVGWATAGFNGEGIEERRLLIDRVSINIGTPSDPECFPDWKKYYHEKMVALIVSKAPFAAQVHGSAKLEGRMLNDLFAEPEILMKSLVSSGLITPATPRQSKFFELLSFRGPMYKVFTDSEIAIILDWIESLSRNYDGCLDPIEDEPAPTPWPIRVAKLIESNSGRARRAHDQLTLPDEEGNARDLTSFLDKPFSLMAALVRGGWVIPGATDRSMFVTRILENGGPMEGELSADEVQAIKNWIDDGAQIPNELKEMSTNELLELDSAVAIQGIGVVPLGINFNKNLESRRYAKEYAELRSFIGQGAVH
jgi:photosystem II stability/assembly factor-like uncharacterized protein